MPLSPTQLTIRKLKAEGWPLVQVVERWNPWAKIRQDLFGFDVLAVWNNRQLWVQCTTAPNVPARVKKLQANPAIRHLASPNICMCVWGWAKTGRKWELKRDVKIEPEP